MEPILKFPDTYFEEEVIDGFYVSTMMKRIWAAQLEIYVEVAKICDKYGIQYFADAGTLLGAVRHGGYIPWDDDFDICMKRTDYERFIELSKTELPKGYSLLSVHTNPNHTYLNARIINSDSIRVDEEFRKKFHDYPYVAGLDIFVMDNITSNKEEEECRCDMLKYLSSVISMVEKSEKEELEKELVKVEEVYKCKIDRDGHIRNQLDILYEKVCAIYKYDDTEELALIPVWLESGNNIYKKEWYEHAIKMKFENIEIMVPAMYDAVLKSKYGNYMKLVKGGGFHDYPCYKKQEAILFEGNDKQKFLTYHFSENDLKNEERKEKKSVKQIAASVMDLLSKAHVAIKEFIDINDVALAMQMLEGCQSGAITLGTRIEEIHGEGYVTVKVLEEYCELTYQLHEMIAAGEHIDSQQAYNVLSGYLLQISESIEEHINKRKEIVFFTYKPSAWKGYENAWQEAIKQADCDVYVVQLPRYKKNFNGDMEDMIEEVGEYPDYVTLTSYEKYDPAIRCPDVIYIQAPYDQYNRHITIHPHYYAANLKKYTDKLIYMPYFLMDEIEKTDAHGMQTTEYFVTVPGVVHADCVYVQSEKMRDTYIDCMCKCAGEETRSIWEEKIVVTPYPIQDESYKKKIDMTDIPKEWLAKITKEDGTYKKVVMYNVSLSNILQYGDVMFEKMRRVFDTFKAASGDVTMIWRTDLNIEILSILLESKSMATYKILVDEINSSDWGIYDDSSDASVAAELCDAYYGDPAREGGMCMNMRKPVMVQSVNL